MLSNNSKKLLKLINDKEINSRRYKAIVLIKGNQVILDGRVVDILNSNEKVNVLMKDYFFNEYGSEDLDEILVNLLPEIIKHLD
ncbi:MAG: hypothetical protein KA369_05855 [Spirochaetes bacterium]|nr:hypothetical protein [Spirochaetota bacterium]